jgi:hypothetical protein
MAKPSRAQRLAKNRAKQEKLKRERARNQNQPVEPAPPPIVAAEPAKEPEAPVANLNTDQQGGGKTNQRPPATWAESTIARCTVALVALAIVQGGAMIWQNGIMREQMSLENRAWLTIKAPTITNIDSGFPAKIEFPISNRGNTPAWMTSGSVSTFYQIGDDDISAKIKEAWKRSEKSLRGDVIPPNGAIRFPTKLTPPFSTDEEQDLIMPLIEQRRATLYVAGQVRYNDIAGQPRYYRLCWRWDPSTKTFLIHQEHNDMN